MDGNCAKLKEFKENKYSESQNEDFFFICGLTIFVVLT